MGFNSGFKGLMYRPTSNRHQASTNLAGLSSIQERPLFFTSTHKLYNFSLLWMGFSGTPMWRSRRLSPTSLQQRWCCHPWLLLRLRKVWR